jgi:uroporphyrin-3 C-methyltransferase
VLGLLALSATLAVAWYGQHQVADLQARMQHSLARLQQEQQQARRSAADLREAQERLAVLENKQADAQSQQLALAAMYQALAKSRDDWLLEDVSHTLLMASQQLQLAANVQGALTALENIDQRLGAGSAAPFARLRTALAEDIGRLKAVANVDVVGVSAKLDVLAHQLDALPLVVDGSRVQPVAAATEASTGWWPTLERQIWHDLKELVRIRRIDKPEPYLLAPEQEFFLRENLKLRLLSARLALLQRDATTFKADIAGARDYLARYFDGRHPRVVHTLDTLNRIATSPVELTLPTLTASLAAVREAQLQQGKGGQ